jgi:cytochrome c2
MKIVRKILCYLILMSFFIGLGVVFEQEKFFPYYRFINAYDRVKAGVKSREALKLTYNYARDTYRWVKGIAYGMLGPAQNMPVTSTINTAVKSPARKPSFDIAERELPSALLPLRISGIQINPEIALATVRGGGGGITVVGNKVVIIDRLDRFYVYDSDINAIRSTEFPALPNYREEFYRWGRYGRNTFFRPHDIEYSKTDGKSFILVSHETFDTKLQTTRLAVHRLQIDPVSLLSFGDWERIFESTPLPLHDTYLALVAGGRMVADGNFVFLTIGDYNQDGVFIPMERPFPSQVKTSDFGSIIKLNILTGERETISYGHRNPQGLMISRKGALISTEHGPRGGDELNLIKPGHNYGWPKVSLGTDYPHYSWPFNKMQGRHDGFTRPVFSWLPSIGISNLIEINDFHERWDGDLLVASLKASSLYRLRMDGEKVIYAEPIWIGQRIRDLAQLANGTIVIWTDQTQLLFLNIAGEKLAGNRFLGIQAVSPIMARCFQCHHVGSTNPSHLAPSLSNIIGRAVASDTQFTKYTDAMKQVGGVWSRERLTKLLTDPARFVPGTSMGMPPMTNLKNVSNLIDELERAK